MDKQSFSSPEAAPAVGPYSPAIGAGDLVFLSGQLALDAQGRLAAITVPDQARKALQNMGLVLEAAGLTFADVVKTTIFLVNMHDFAAVNDVYGEFFREPFPARSTVEVAALPKEAKVEIEAVAVRG
jgi:2-iminobutanoate/2-iminopropanoate deaminase